MKGEATSVGNLPIEVHPWEPWTPDGARVLMLGTFPPGRQRWSMDFYYPNPTNDFWRIIGLLFEGNPLALWIPSEKRFDLARIQQLTRQNGIAMSDTCVRIRRLKNNASDKFLEVVEPRNIEALANQMPALTDIVATGEKAATLLAEATNTAVPKIGTYSEWQRGSQIVRLWRLPSTSRAYPLALTAKAEYYLKMFKTAHIL